MIGVSFQKQMINCNDTSMRFPSLSYVYCCEVSSLCSWQFYSWAYDAEFMVL